MLCFPQPPLHPSFHSLNSPTNMTRTMHISAAPDPSPSPSPTPTPSYSTAAATTTPDDASTASQTESKINFSPPLIAMVIVIISAFLIITYSRLISKHVSTPILNLIRHWRRRSNHVASSSAGDLESFHHQSNPNFFDSADQYHSFSPYGLNDSVIKTIPLSIYNSNQQGLKKQSNVEVVVKDCAVCLLEFKENDYLRTLPICTHAFHVDCIDIWLRSHANCPLCRARIILCSQSSSPFVPLMAGRIRPSLDGILDSILLEPFNEVQSENIDSDSQTHNPEQSIQGTAPEQEFDFVDRRNLLLRRSYSFGFERSFQQATTSPWRRSSTTSFWNKRRLSASSPFNALTKSRVFSFRSTRLTKSPFFARRGRGGGLGLFPFSESSSMASLSRRRSKSMASTPAAGFSSSRLRCGDPEALLSPERYNRRL